MATKTTTSNKTLADALDEIRLAFANFCADAEAIINEAKDKKGGNNGRN